MSEFLAPEIEKAIDNYQRMVMPFVRSGDLEKASFFLKQQVIPLALEHREQIIKLIPSLEITKEHLSYLFLLLLETKELEVFYELEQKLQILVNQYTTTHLKEVS